MYSCRLNNIDKPRSTILGIVEEIDSINLIFYYQVSIIGENATLTLSHVQLFYNSN